MFEIFKTSAGKFSFRLLAKNGQIILASQSYTSLEACEAGIASVKANAGKPEQFQTKEAKDGSPYFVLVGENGEIIGKSETYSSPAAAKNGIASVQKNAEGAVKNTIA